MRLSEKAMIRSLLVAAPMILSSTIAISPSRAASFATSTGVLVLENFTLEPNSITTDTSAFADAISSPGSEAEAIASPTEALATPTGTAQISTAQASGSGPRYFARANSSSDTALSFNTDGGYFQFDFSAVLAAIAEVTNPSPGEVAAADSFVAFYIFDDKNQNPIDFFEASLSAGNPFNIVSTNAIQFDSLPDPGELSPLALVRGSYARSFDPGTALTVRGVTSTSAIAQVPEPPMFAALVILPGLMWLKRRKAKAIAQRVTIDRQSE